VATPAPRWLPAGEYAEIMDSTFWGTVHTTLAALPMLRHTKGRILAVTSVGGKLPAPHLLAYTTAKHAAVGFAEGLRIEASAQGVSVTVGEPGLMRTGSTRNALFAGNREQERRCFTAGASLPILSMDAERAAAKLVRATLRGRPRGHPDPAGQVRHTCARPCTSHDAARTDPRQRARA
jgi:NAD(P)-dependent dehydrogenase (short-subunit alcohol dehydrogenase family)